MMEHNLNKTLIKRVVRYFTTLWDIYQYVVNLLLQSTRFCLLLNASMKHSSCSDTVTLLLQTILLHDILHSHMNNAVIFVIFCLD